MASATAERSKKKSGCKLRPTGDMVIILPDDPEKVTKGGIILSDNAQTRSARGRVLAAGKGAITPHGRSEMEVQEGDSVFFNMYAGTELELSDDLTVRVLKQSDILVVLDN